MALFKQAREYEWMARRIGKERDQALYQPRGRPRQDY
jgi:hypothetical protein